MIVYCVLFPNGKRYIGKTECPIHKRMREHKHRSKTATTRFYNAVRKYGWENLDWIILEECVDSETLSQKEKGWIKKFDSLNRDKGYNLREGGEGGRHSDETKQKISASNSGEKNGMHGKSSWNKGLKLSEEHRKKLSESHKGQVAWNKGMKGEYTMQPRSEETKRKLSKANSGENNGQAKLTWEIVRAIREEYSKGNVLQKDLAQKYGLSRGHISELINFKRWKEA